jgi:GNAT superfamily N-acetyltransferase
LAKNLRNLIIVGQQERRSHCLLLAEDEQGLLIGGLIGCIESHFFSCDPVANLIAYGVSPGHRMTGAAVRLMKAFIEWAKRRGVVEVNAGVNSGIDLERTDRFITKMGFSKMGFNYAMSLKINQENQSY